MHDVRPYRSYHPLLVELVVETLRSRTAVDSVDVHVQNEAAEQSGLRGDVVESPQRIADGTVVEQPNSGSVVTRFSLSFFKEFSAKVAACG